MTASFLWGSSFTAIKIATEVLDSFSYMWLRASISLLLLLPFTLHEILRRRRAALIDARRGCLTGIFYGLTLWLQGWGTSMSTASKASFITGLHAVVVHLYASLIERRYSPWLALSLVLAIAGLYALTNPEATGLGLGDVLLIASCFTLAIQVVLVSRFSDSNPITFVFFEMLPATFFVIPDVLTGGVESMDLRTFAALLYLAAVCGNLGFALQLLGQRYVDPATATIIYQTIPIFGALTAFVVLGERMSVMQMIGAAMIFAAMILAVIEPRKVLS